MQKLRTLMSVPIVVAVLLCASCSQSASAMAPPATVSPGLTAHEDSYAKSLDINFNSYDKTKIDNAANSLNALVQHHETGAATILFVLRDSNLAYSAGTVSLIVDKGSAPAVTDTLSLLNTVAYNAKATLVSTGKMRIS